MTDRTLLRKMDQLIATMQAQTAATEAQAMAIHELAQSNNDLIAVMMAEATIDEDTGEHITNRYLDGTPH